VASRVHTHSSEGSSGLVGLNVGIHASFKLGLPQVNWFTNIGKDTTRSSSSFSSNQL
jgi:hypothetical protein